MWINKAWPESTRTCTSQHAFAALVLGVNTRMSAGSFPHILCYHYNLQDPLMPNAVPFSSSSCFDSLLHRAAAKCSWHPPCCGNKAPAVCSATCLHVSVSAARGKTGTEGDTLVCFNVIMLILLSHQFVKGISVRTLISALTQLTLGVV